MNSHTQPFLRQTRSPSSPRRPRAQVFSYPWQRPGCLGGRTRAPHHRRLVFGGASATEDKARWAGVWRDLWGRAWLRDILVIINPVGGVRGAARVYEKVCAAAAAAASLTPLRHANRHGGLVSYRPRHEACRVTGRDHGM